MNFDDGLRSFIQRCEAAFPPDYMSYPLAGQREMYRALCREFERPRPAGLEVSDHEVPSQAHGVPVRLYRPEGEGVLPCLVYMHGGGWIFGDLDSHDGICAELAVRAEVAVLAVDYRLAPEHRFPAAVEDCAAVLDHLAREEVRWRIDPARIGVGGDSAGGNLAAALCLRSRDRGGPRLRAQILIYPGLGLGLTEDGRPSSGDAPLLAEDELGTYARAYLGPSGTTADPYAAPLLAKDFASLPAAYVQAVEYDPLRADAEAYAEKLAAAGVPVELEVAPGLVHGCLRARFISDAAGQAFGNLCRATGRLLSA